MEEPKPPQQEDIADQRKKFFSHLGENLGIDLKEFNDEVRNTIKETIDPEYINPL